MGVSFKSLDMCCVQFGLYIVVKKLLRGHGEGLSKEARWNTLVFRVKNNNGIGGAKSGKEQMA